ncbi:hypothetical protein COU59_03425 [Candidatus Pacearchaeota archaeon CG10_big_fil_rev_8_21_14_0_10_34_12]|nr:MAG: hypothetical protein COU59_03425 [Candidatus Pacearchaeota archaeon CG10_big_fil_rev_8_21_14_0_10_34_12]
MAQKFNELALAYSLAIVSAAGMLLAGIFGYTGFYGGMVNIMMQGHMYFRISPFGIITGMIEAAAWGFILGYLIAWVYNKFN